MQLQISTYLDCSIEQAITHAKTTRMLKFVAHPLVHFTPITPSTWPDTWAEGTYWVGVRILGLLPFGRQAIVISFPPSEDGFLLRDNGFSALVNVWDHTISISSEAGQTRYMDTVTINAGVFTLPVWLFAQAFYRHRQRRWRLLARHVAEVERPAP
jgi:hypothetical protein